nr:hypothetical protein [Tanacetum cinerariifolium]GEX44645.1 hypothetical protein [Tanacetum cinerariifolium]
MLNHQEDLNQKNQSQADEPVFEAADTEMPVNQGDDLGNTDDQPNIDEASRDDWFKKLERPLTLDSYWNTTKSIDFKPPQTWISKIAKAEKPPLTFDELMITPIDFSAYVINNLKIENLTQEHLVVLAFNLLKGTCRSRVEREYHFKECGSSSRKYVTYTTKTKAAKYNAIEGIEDMVPSYASNRESKHDVLSTKRIIAVTHVKVMKWYDYGYLEEIVVQREDQHHYKFKEGDFPRLNLRVVILKQVEDLQLGVKSYQKKLNITKPETFRSDITNMTTYTAYNNPKGIIYLDKLKRNRFMRSDELYKFCDSTLTSV